MNEVALRLSQIYRANEIAKEKVCEIPSESIENCLINLSRINRLRAFSPHIPNLMPN